MRIVMVVGIAVLASACVVIPVDGGSGGKAGGDTVVVCHKGKKTMELPREAAKAHLDHGDRAGPC